MKKPLVAITGAGSGIGKATAQLFSAKGHPLLLLGRNIEKLQALDLSDSICREVDVADSNAFKIAVNEAEEKFGPVDCMINNAGMMLLGDIATQDPAEWKEMFDTNILGVLNGMQAVLPQMKARRSGTIINTGSVAGRKTFPNHVAYCGSKFGVHTITENAREEAAASNVRMVTIAPGAVETSLLSHTTSEEIKEGYESWKKDMGGALNPSDIANAMWYAYQQPQGVNIREIVIAATRQQP